MSEKAQKQSASKREMFEYLVNTYLSDNDYKGQLFLVIQTQKPRHSKSKLLLHPREQQCSSMGDRSKSKIELPILYLKRHRQEFK